jgi:hypothetical protein
MKIVVVTKKPVLTQFGRLPKDVPVEVNDHLARFLIDRGDAVAFETKEKMDYPPLAAGMMAQSSALPVAQASTETTSSASEPGAKRRGRPRKEA